MYLGVDIGGTKTLVARLNNEGVIQEKYKFPTSQNYHQFISQLEEVIRQFSSHEYKAATVAIPAMRIDRKEGVALSFSNLAWRNVSIEADVEKIVKCPVFIENDAKLAGLSEAMLVKDRYSKVLYVTVSTGIGFAIINDCKIDVNAGDGGGRTITLERDGKQVAWEKIVSGHAIVERFGKLAKDINDEDTWQKIAKDLAEGLIELIAIFQPELVVIGGSVGNYFSKFGHLLDVELRSYNLNLPLIKMPHLKGAERPDDAVVYGCYDLAKQINADG